MNRIRVCLFGLLALCAVPLIAEIIVQPKGGGGGIGGNNNTNGYSFSGGFTIVNATNVSLQPAISNIVMTGVITNLADSQFANETTVAVIKSGAAVSNVQDFTTFTIFGDTFVSTNLWVSNNIVASGSVLASGGLSTLSGNAVSTFSGANFITMDSSLHVIGSTFDPLVFTGNTNHILELSTNTSYFKSNLVVQGRLDGMSVRLIGGQNASSMAIVDGNTNIVGWISTNVFGDIAGVTNGLTTRVDNLDGSTNWITTVLSKAVTNGDTRTTWINNLNVGNDLIVTNQFNVKSFAFFDTTLFASQDIAVTGDVGAQTATITSSIDVQGGGTLNGIFFVFSGFDPSSTNIIHSLTSDSTPANGDFIMTEDISTGLLKKVSIGNLPTGSGEVNYVGDAGLTNSTKTSLAHSKQGVTNFLKTIEAGYGIIRTNQGTNINFAIDPTIVGGSAAGGSGAIQFAEGTAFRGTNSPATQQFAYNATNGNLIVNKTGVGELHIFANRLVEISTTPLLFGVAGNTNWQISNLADFSPTTTDVYDIGTSALRVRTNWLRFGDFSSGLVLRDPASVNSGRGTIFAHPSDWKVTNQFNFSVTNAQAGNALVVNSASISGGLASIIVTNEPLNSFTSLVGQTNLTPASVGLKSYYQATNADHGINITLAVPPAGYAITVYHTNSAATNYVVTFYTNSVAASFYSIVDQTNSSSWSVPLGSIVGQRFQWTGSQWLRTDEERSLLSLTAGYAFAFRTNGLVMGLELTNRQASFATNVTSATVDFSDLANLNIYNASFHLTTNLVISPTNLVVGRTTSVYFDTNALSYDVMVTNLAATEVHWNFNVTTNGSTCFRKTNTLRAKLFLTAETNGIITADFGYYR